MEFGVLGPLLVKHDGAALPLGTPKQQLVLAHMVISADEAVSLNAVIDELWGERPPPSAVANARSYAAALRRLFATAQPGVERLVRAGSGYLLRAKHDEVDLRLFYRDVDQGRAAQAAGDLPAALACFEQALARWRGVILDGLPCGPLLVRQCAAVEQTRLRVVDSLAEINLRLGRPELADYLMNSQLQAEPLREQSYALLMRARYRIDGAAGALAVFETVRTNLAEQLGIEPCPELQRLHLAVLNRELELDGPPRSAAGRGPGAGAAAPDPPAPAGEPSPAPALPSAAPVPRTLPPDLPDFVGRLPELALLQETLTRATGTTVVAVVGPGGVGKTALCLRVAHALLDDYPGGQLYADLHGLDTAAAAAPIEVLGRFLRVLGIDDGSMPGTVDERAELYRNLLSDRRVLILLDDAASDDQVRPLIPGGRRCGVIINSRARLGAPHGSPTIYLDVLAPAEAADLLRNLVGAQRAEAESAAVVELGRLCGHLPLALRIAGGRLAAKPHWSARKLAHLLRDERTRLDQLSLGQLDVRASIAPSYGKLAPQAQRLLRRIGDLNVPEVSSWVSAALLDAPVTAAEDVLEQLFDAHLIQVDGQDAGGYPRYRLHDLVRLFAQGQAEQDDSPPVRRAARQRAISADPAIAERPAMLSRRR